MTALRWPWLKSIQLQAISYIDKICNHIHSLQQSVPVARICQVTFGTLGHIYHLGLVLTALVIHHAINVLTCFLKIKKPVSGN